MAVFSWRVSILQRPHLGEVPPDQKGRSDRQFTGDPAIGSITGSVRSWGPEADIELALTSTDSGVVRRLSCPPKR
jgi:hypothetical protein